MTKAVFFDMNQTLLNLSLLKDQFDEHFDNEYVLKYWFTKLLHSSTVMGIMGEYKNFGELAGVALENLFIENNKILKTETKEEILGKFRMLPAYDDVVPALSMLKESEIRVIAVSNSSLEMMEQQLSNASIIDFFDSYYSVDKVSLYKPFKDIYISATEDEDILTSEVVMVATHDWDLFGAKKAGLRTAFVKRKEEMYHPFYLEADYKANTLPELIRQIIEDE